MPQGSGGVKAISASSATAAVASTTAAVTPDSGDLPWIALIIFTLIMLVAGTRLIYGPFEANAFRGSRFRIIRRAASRG